VFREIATKLYAMYVEKKEAPNYVTKKDSSGYFYAGYTRDIKNIFSKLDVSYNDSTTQDNWSSVYAKKAVPVIKGTNVQGKFMPNVKGMGLKDALYLLENTGIKVVVKGKGKIINQSIPPGTPLTKGFTVLVELG
jgi:cell division protein FtsI (penicillin-binding protein 3)